MNAIYVWAFLSISLGLFVAWMLSHTARDSDCYDDEQDYTFRDES